MLIRPLVLLIVAVRWQASAGAAVIGVKVSSTLTSGRSEGDDEAGYFALSDTLDSAMRFAVDDVNKAGTLLEGNMSISIVSAESTTSAVEALCSALLNSEEPIYGVVGPFLSAQAGVMETFSNADLGLPLVSPSAAAAHEQYFTKSGGEDDPASSFLLGVQPDVYQQMSALVRLILDMKNVRDSIEGWQHASERVWVLHSNTVYGSTAAAAFEHATTNITGVNLGSTSSGEEPSTVEIMSIEAIPSQAESDFTMPLQSLKQRGAYIIVLLAEEYDVRLVRNILKQADSVGMVGRDIQWYLSDPTAMDSLFDVNETYRDTTLAYNMRGTLGVRPCTPLQGVGSEEAADLLEKWTSADSEVYPSAGETSLMADGQLEPLVAFTYDAVYAMAIAIGEAQAAAGGEAFLDGYSPDSCPFPSNGRWANGGAVRNATLQSSFVGTTGQIDLLSWSDSLRPGQEFGIGWRETNGTTHCSMNLQEDSTQGAVFVTIGRWTTGRDNASMGYFMEQDGVTITYPQGGERYPFDRATLKGKNIQFATQSGAAPFTVVSSDDDGTTTVGGITMLFLEELGKDLGFTYNVTVLNNSYTTTDLVEIVAEGLYDMAGSWITITEDRAETVSFSYPYFDVTIALVYLPYSDTSIDLWRAFTPFEPSLWFVVFLALLATLTLLWLYEGKKNEELSVGSGINRRRRPCAGGMIRSSYITVSLLLGQLTHKPETLEGYVLTVGWMLFCFIMAASFTAELASFLTEEREAAEVATIEDLMSGVVSHTEVALLQGGTTQSYYERNVMQCTGAMCSEGDTPQKCYDVDECFGMVLDGDAAVTLIDSATAEYEILRKYPDLAVEDEFLDPQHYGLVLPIDTQYSEELQQSTLRLREDNTLAYLQTLYFNYTTTPETITGNLTVAELSGVFLVLGIFISSSFIIWAIRNHPCVRRNWQRYHNRRRKVGKKKKNDDAEEESVDETEMTYRSLSRKQQKAFAMEAMVKLLKERQEEGRSATGTSAPEDVQSRTLKHEESTAGEDTFVIKTSPRRFSTIPEASPGEGSTSSRHSSAAHTDKARPAEHVRRKSDV